jgi:acyl carrier protein
MVIQTKDSTLPPLWEVEQGVLQLVCEQEGLEPDTVSLDSRLVEDLNIDSLALTELFLAVEEKFGIEISDEMAQQAFTNQSVTLRMLAHLVLQLWGTGTPVRENWIRQRERLAPVEEAPFTQLCGTLPSSAWRSEPLYAPLGINREGYSQFLRRTDGMRCVLIPRAEVVLGSSEPETFSDQQPSHSASLSEFLIDAEPVSNTAYARFLNSVAPIEPGILQEWCGVKSSDKRAQHFSLQWSRGKWQPLPKTERQPMILVSWFGANAYSLWANGLDWRYYHGDGTVDVRLQALHTSFNPSEQVTTTLEAAGWSCLPSEAQWEYAARGNLPRRFPWGDGLATPELLRTERHQVGAAYTADSLPAENVSARLGMSPFGLHHMAGNVWQWCRDWYAPDFYSTPAATEPNPQNHDESGIRSERGGSWVGPVELAASTYRRGRVPIARGRCLGFRCVGSPVTLANR